MLIFEGRPRPATRNKVRHLAVRTATKHWRDISTLCRYSWPTKWRNIITSFQSREYST